MDKTNNKKIEDHREQLMRKNIEIKPEWILNTMTDSITADCNGYAYLGTDSGSNANWIALALETLDIEYDEYYCDESDTLHCEFIFDIAQFKDVNPDFYHKLNYMDNHNHVFQLYRNLYKDDPKA